MNKMLSMPLSAGNMILTAAVGAAFFAVWLLWPQPARVNAPHKRLSSETRFVFMNSPAYASPSPVDFLLHPARPKGGLSYEDLNEKDVLAPSRTDAAVLLPWSRPQGGPALTRAVPSDPEPIAFPPPETPVFGRPGGARPAIVRVDVSDSLKARGFDKALALAAASLPQPEKPWVVRAGVSLDEHGSVVHVLIDTPTAHAELNSALLRAIYGTRAGKGDGACDGTIRISGNGRKPERASD